VKASPSARARAAKVRAALLLMLPALLLVGILYMLPLARLTMLSFGEGQASLDAYKELFATWSYGETMFRSIRMSALTVLGCIFFGYPIAYVLAFSSLRARSILLLLVLLPFWTSILVRNFAWIYLLREQGVISTVAGFLFNAGEPVQILYKDTAVLIATINTLLPFMVFPIYLAISSQDRSLREAAISLGASPPRVFFSVTLPLSRNGMLAGILLVFATALGLYITPALLAGGRVMMAATFINQQIEEFLNWPLAAAASLIVLAAVVCVATLYYRFVETDITGGSRAAD
jgi:ABC-type spermidine/putrescine transport system permease subunit I